MKGMAFRRSHERELDHRTISITASARVPSCHIGVETRPLREGASDVGIGGGTDLCDHGRLRASRKRTGDIFTFNVLLSIGLCLLALHLSGGVGKWSRR
jgi:hypothetical protein